MASTCSAALPKLTYFNLAGRVLPLRIALFKAFGKEGWIDDRIEFSEWAALKPTTPLGSVPVLTLSDGEGEGEGGRCIGGRVIQSDALTRWAGMKSGLYPTDDPDRALLVDEVIATSLEALSKTPRAPEGDEEAKKNLREEYAAGFLSKALGWLEGRVKASASIATPGTNDSNQEGSPASWVAGTEDMTVGDLYLLMLTEMIVTGDFDYVPPSLILEGFPALATHRDQVKEHTLVQDYYANYPN